MGRKPDEGDAGCCEGGRELVRYGETEGLRD